MEDKEVQQSKKPTTKLEVREYILKFYTFDREFVDNLLKESKEIYNEALKSSSELAYAPPIYAIKYDDGRILRTYNSEDFINKFSTANDIWDISIEFNKNAMHSLKNLEIIIKRTHNPEDLTYAQYKNAISVSGDDSTWVEGSFSRIQALTKKYANTNKWFYSEGFELSVQFFAVLFLITVSLFLSRSLAPYFEIEPVYLFIISLLLLSNLWTYVSKMLYDNMRRLKPIVTIINKPPSMRPAVIFYGILTSVIGAMIFSLFKYVPTFLK